LLLSEALAERCGVSRYYMGSGSWPALDLPNQSELYARAACLQFSRRDLDGIGCALDRLAPFIHTETPAQGGWGKSTLELRPLVRSADGVLVQIWKLKQQDSELDARNIHFGNINGELNLLGYWQENGERLIPFDASASGMTIQLGTNFIADVRRDLRSVYDLHALGRLNPNVSVPVRRYNTDPFFKETVQDPIFVDEAAARRGRLRGVIETAQRPWWI
jgi:hypothetical protein